MDLEEKPFPTLTQGDLVDLCGWTVLKEARGLLGRNAVAECVWEAPILRGRVEISTESYFPKFNLRSTIFAENQCNCTRGRQGYVCSHAIALCLSRMEERKQAQRAEEEKERLRREAEARKPAVRSLVLSNDKSLPLTFEVFLPPNLPKVAERDAIMVKVEAIVQGERVSPESLDRGRAYRMSDPDFLVAAIIEDWCEGRLHGLLQLSRARLRKLLEPLVGEPVVFWINARDHPLSWDSNRIAGVFEFLDEDDSSTTSQTTTSIGDQVGSTQNGPDSAGAADFLEGSPTAAKERAGDRVGSDHRPESMRLYPSLSDLRKDHSPAIAGEKMQVDGSTHFLAITLPSREAAEYKDAVNLVRSNGFQLEPKNRKWWLRDRRRTLEFLARHWTILVEQFSAEFTESFQERTAKVSFAEIQARAEDGDGEEDFAVTVGLRVDGVDPDEIGKTLLQGHNFLDTRDGVVLLNPDTLSRLERIQRGLSGQVDRPLTPTFRRRLPVASLTDAEKLLEEESGSFEAPKQWRERSAALRSVDALQPAPVRQSLDNRLRGYQRIGAAWMWHLSCHRLGGILADEMGLGKTVQALALISVVCNSEEELSGPCLVVCPAGLVENWKREAGNFVPWLRVFGHHRATRLTQPAEFLAYDLIVTSYSTLAHDADLMSEISFAAVVADEAQHVKNRQTRNAKALRGLQAERRFALTGTPVENTLDDLRSIFEFLMPGYLQRVPAHCGREDRAWFDLRQRQQAAPYILRRSKALVAPELPEKLEQIVFCDMSTRQSALYKDFQRKTQEEISTMQISGAGENAIRFAALQKLLRLRQICADPRLLDESLLLEDSAKLNTFLELLDEAMDGGHRVLLFSQFVSVLTLIREALEERELPYAYLDGQTINRLEVCDRFNSDPSIPLFLISLRAGGTGLNLTGADTVVHYDPWWNPAVEAQATDRAHRIGQTRSVTSLKLITAGSVEEKVLALQEKKAGILRDLLDESAASTARVGVTEIMALLE